MIGGINWPPSEDAVSTEAAFARGMPNFTPEPPRPPVAQQVTVYHAQPYSHHDPLGRPVEPQLFVDVSNLVDRKIELLKHHASQKRWLDESQGHDSYLEALRELDEACGRMSGLFTAAEGWRRHLHWGFCGPKDDPLSEALKGNVLVA